MKTYRILGMMSGTSLDGLDLVLTELKRDGGRWSYHILDSDCVAYDPGMRDRLEDAISLSAPDLLAFHSEYGHWLGTCARDFLKSRGETADALASHGHTVHHRPEKGFTFQLGDPRQVALASGILTVGDFRSLDVALGGQGAPLVPIGDRLLFGDFECCLNLGGISNVSFENPGGRMAFDIGICNMLLNHLSRLGGAPYDDGGEMARSGKMNPELLRAFDSLPYYSLPFPKSTGYEWFQEAYLPLLLEYRDTPENLLRTAVIHIAGKIGEQLTTLSGKAPASVLVTGGGALNAFLIEEIRRHCGPGIRLHVPDDRLIEAKEGLVFALLGALRLEREVNVLASVTGAKRDSSSGVICDP